jgi:Domain of unknown function (DUF5916)
MGARDFVSAHFFRMISRPAAARPRNEPDKPMTTAFQSPALGASLLALCLATPLAQAAEEAVQAVRLREGERIALDGTLSHPAWQRAPVFERAYEIEPVRGRTPTHGTRVQVLYDEHALYVGVAALDPQPELIRAPLVRHDQVNRTQDFVVLYVDPIGARRSAQFFRVGASGSTGDGLHTAANDGEDFAPDFDWDSAVARDSNGYSVVFRIPFASLRYTTQGNGGWRVMVGRRIPRDNVVLTLSVPLPHEALSFIDRMQPLAGFEAPREHGFLQLRPTLTLRRSVEEPYGTARSANNDTDISLDAKWRALPELVVDATVNPDFAQIALDQPQLANSTRFALLLTEKRPFFLESTDLLMSDSDALYTRSVTDPRWGLRATWRAEQSGGSGLVLRDQGGGSVLIPGPFGTGFALQPKNNALLSRAQVRTGALSLGAIAGARDYRDANGGDGGGNAVGGADAQWLVSDSLRLKAQVMGSRSTALDDGSGGLRRGGAVRGALAHLALFGKTERSETDLSVLEVSHGFRNDVGFVAQAGTRKLVGKQSLRWFELGPLNQFHAYLNAERTEERGTGLAVLQRWAPGAWMAAANNTELVLELVPREKSRVSRDGALHDAHYVHLWGQTTLASWAPLLEAWFDTGRLVDVLAGPSGRVVPGSKFGFELRSRVLPRLELQPRLDALVLRNPVEGRYREVAAQLLSVWHFTATQTLRLIAQRHSFGRSGSEQAQTAQSLTYARRRSASTVLYVGATRGSTGLPTMPSRSSEVFAKLQLDAGGLFP